MDLYLYFFLCPFLFGDHLAEKGRAGCFTIIEFLLLCMPLFWEGVPGEGVPGEVL